MPTIIEKLFGRKQSRTAAIISRNVSGADAVWTPNDYKRLAEEGYRQAVWVFACVKEIVQASKECPVLLYRRRGDEVEELTDHPMLELLNRPNQFQSWASFLEDLIAYWLLSGNTYIERVGPDNGPPVELWAKRPDRMKVLPSPTELVRGYRFELRNQKIDFLNGEVLHIKSFHPLNDWYGMSVIEAAARGTDAFNAGMRHNVALLQQGARPSGALIVEGRLDDNQFSRLRDQITAYQGPDNAGKPFLFEGGANWQDMSFSPKELDWLNGLSDAGRQIHAAFGVHPVLTGLQEGTFENQRQASRQLYTRTVLPTMGHVLGEMSRWLVPLYGDESLTLGVDDDQIDALSDDQDSLYDRTTEAFRIGILTRNESRLQLGFGEVDGGDVFINDLQTAVNISDTTLAGTDSRVEVKKNSARRSTRRRTLGGRMNG